MLTHTHTHTHVHFCCMPVARMFAIRRLGSWFHGDALVGIMRFDGWIGRIGRRYDDKRKTCASWWLQPTGFCLCQIGSISQVEMRLNKTSLKPLRSILPTTAVITLTMANNSANSSLKHILTNRSCQQEPSSQLANLLNHMSLHSMCYICT